MKQILLLLMFIGIGFGTAIAQPNGGACTPDTTFCTPQEARNDTACISPTDGLMPCYTAGQYYEEVLYFVIADEVDAGFTTIQLDRIRIKDVTVGGNPVPAWLDFLAVSSNSNDPNIDKGNLGSQPEINANNGSQYGPVGCFTVYGTIDQNFTDDTLSVEITAAAVVGGFEVAELPVTVRIPNCNLASRNDVALANSLKLQPNPAADQTELNVTVLEATAGQLQVVDLNGRVVYSRQVNTLTPGEHRLSIPTAEFAPGMYMVNLQLGDQLMSEKLLKH